MAILGCHMSISGGFFEAVNRAAEAGCDCVQVFTLAPRIWPKPAMKPVSQDDSVRFRDALDEQGIQAPLVHASYLINLASPDDVLWNKSIDALETELRRADALSIPYVVFHPGSYTKSDPESGLRRVAEALDEIHSRTESISSSCLLETTAGQGTNLGFEFEQLAEILSQVTTSDRLGICFDTCHVFAAGYPLVEQQEYQDTMQQFDHTIGIDRLRAFHLNDSQHPLGSKRDRHEHIGEGCLGLEPFRHLLNDSRFEQVPMYLETPKGDEAGRSWDEINLETLRRLIES
ncbi:MAG: deoxyribonuclease IV [Planctomycetaceae bacterium]|nr:deoxyribonuclease IV [Planctomycetaceae bacterium]